MNIGSCALPRILARILHGHKKSKLGKGVRANHFSRSPKFADPLGAQNLKTVFSTTRGTLRTVATIQTLENWADSEVGCLQIEAEDPNVQCFRHNVQIKKPNSPNILNLQWLRLF